VWCEHVITRSAQDDLRKNATAAKKAAKDAAAKTTAETKLLLTLIGATKAAITARTTEVENQYDAVHDAFVKSCTADEACEHAAGELARAVDEEYKRKKDEMLRDMVKRARPRHKQTCVKRGGVRKPTLPRTLECHEKRGRTVHRWIRTAGAAASDSESDSHDSADPMFWRHPRTHELITTANGARCACKKCEKRREESDQRSPPRTPSPHKSCARCLGI
jgi:hypothetical protein